jgi:hypothetical protein
MIIFPNINDGKLKFEKWKYGFYSGGGKNIIMFFSCQFPLDGSNWITLRRVLYNVDKIELH